MFRLTLSTGLSRGGDIYLYKYLKNHFSLTYLHYNSVLNRLMHLKYMKEDKHCFFLEKKKDNVLSKGHFKQKPSFCFAFMSSIYSHHNVIR